MFPVHCITCTWRGSVHVGSPAGKFRLLSSVTEASIVLGCQCRGKGVWEGEGGQCWALFFLIFHKTFSFSNAFVSDLSYFFISLSCNGKPLLIREWLIFLTPDALSSNLSCAKYWLCDFGHSFMLWHSIPMCVWGRGRGISHTNK